MQSYFNKKSYSSARFFGIAINDFQNKLLMFFTKIYSRTMSFGKEKYINFVNTR